MIRWCLLVLALIAMHQVFMGSGRCAQVMDERHGHPAHASQGEQVAEPMHAAGATLPMTPLAPAMALADCPAQRAVLPFLRTLALLLAYAGVLGEGRVPISAARWSGGRGFWLPPPLDSARRRAFLQIFQN